MALLDRQHVKAYWDANALISLNPNELNGQFGLVYRRNRATGLPLAGRFAAHALVSN